MVEYLQNIFPASIYILFVLGFVLLIKGADWLVEGSSAIAKKFNISDIVIGLTIVSFGTSAPELAVNLIASSQESPDIAIGNILGSNVANILLILGIASLITPLAVKRNTTWKEIPMSLLAAVLVGVLANDIFIDGGSKNMIGHADGLVLIGFFIIFLYYTFGMARAGGETASSEVQQMDMKRATIMTIVGLIALPIGGDWIVQGSVHIARSFHLRESVISLTIIAIGTSLPEVAASAVAAYKKRADIAIGNAVGSNIFNVFWVLGLSSIIRPLPFKVESNRDVGMAGLAALLLFVFIFLGRRHVLQRHQGVLFLVFYVSYIAYLAMNAGI